MFIQTHSLMQQHIHTISLVHTNTVLHINILTTLSYFSSLEGTGISLQTSAAWFYRLLPHKSLYECWSSFQSVEVVS